MSASRRREVQGLGAAKALMTFLQELADADGVDTSARGESAARRLTKTVFVKRMTPSLDAELIMWSEVMKQSSLKDLRSVSVCTGCYARGL